MTFKVFISIMVFLIFMVLLDINVRLSGVQKMLWMKR